MTFSRSTIYALDIETHTGFDAVLGRNANGLDPREARITEISVSTEDGDAVFSDDDELALISGAERFLASLQPGLVATWNGAFFDLPFLADRISRQAGPESIQAPRSTMHLIGVPGLAPKYAFLPGHSVGYSASWRAAGRSVHDRHQHLDIANAYREQAYREDFRWGLKPTAEANGIEMITVDRTRMHDLTPAERSAYAASDTRGTRLLAIRLLGA